MKTVHTAVACLLLALFLSGYAMAETKAGQPIGELPETAETAEENKIAPPKTAEEQASAMGAESLKEALPKDAKKILGDLSITDVSMGDEGLKAIYAAIKENFFGILKNALKSASKILTIIILCAAVTSAMNDGPA
ncbi:MAG: hypothetical protein GX488_02265, partial [Clostridiales bacterium]|nr:hypothetical protein [Clostridiales bacterium]